MDEWMGDSLREVGRSVEGDEGRRSRGRSSFRNGSTVAMGEKEMDKRW